MQIRSLCPANTDQSIISAPHAMMDALGRAERLGQRERIYIIRRLSPGDSLSPVPFSIKWIKIELLEVLVALGLKLLLLELLVLVHANHKNLAAFCSLFLCLRDDL